MALVNRFNRSFLARCIYFPFHVLLTYGDLDFYSKVGFKSITEDIIKAPLNLTYPNGWLALSLTDKKIDPIQGSTMCVSALMNQKYW